MALGRSGRSVVPNGVSASLIPGSSRTGRTISSQFTDRQIDQHHTGDDIEIDDRVGYEKSEAVFPADEEFVYEQGEEATSTQHDAKDRPDARHPFKLDQSVEHDEEDRDVKQQEPCDAARQSQYLPFFFVCGFDLVQHQEHRVDDVDDDDESHSVRFTFPDTS